MKDKEDILNDALADIIAILSDGFTQANIEKEYNRHLQAMSEYAKQQSIDFAKFIWGVYECSGTIENMKWFDPDRRGHEPIDTDELYQLFEQSQNKQP